MMCIQTDFVQTDFVVRDIVSVNCSATITVSINHHGTVSNEHSVVTGG